MAVGKSAQCQLATPLYTCVFEAAMFWAVFRCVGCGLLHCACACTKAYSGFLSNLAFLLQLNVDAERLNGQLHSCCTSPMQSHVQLQCPAQWLSEEAS